MKSNTNEGLRQQIAEATNIEQIDNLLLRGKANYAHASFKTVRQWQTTADRRRKELSNASPAPKGKRSNERSRS